MCFLYYFQEYNQTPENIFQNIFWNTTKHLKIFSFPENILHPTKHSLNLGWIVQDSIILYLTFFFFFNFQYINFRTCNLLILTFFLCVYILSLHCLSLLQTVLYAELILLF